MATDNTLNALQSLEGLLSQDPENDELLQATFDQALRSGRLRLAQELLDRGMNCGRSQPAWQLRRAHAWMAMHDWTAARDSLSALVRSTDLPALQATAIQDLALVELRSGRAKEGLKVLSQLEQAKQGQMSAALQSLKLRLLHAAGRTEEAVELARSWAELRILGDDAFGVASLAALDAEHVELARTWSDYALSRSPLQLEALVTSASLALGRQDGAKADALLKIALEVNREDGRTWSAWAFGALLAGDLALALQRFKLALRYMPGHIGTWHGAGWAALLSGDLAGATAAFEKALEIDRNFGESYAALAVVSAKRGHVDDARAGIQKAMRLDPTSLGAHYAQAVLDGQSTDAQAMRRLATRLLRAQSGSR